MRPLRRGNGRARRRFLLPRLFAALKSPHADVRNQAVLVLRHWAGRGPGQTAKLYDTLTRDAKATP